jgi:DNA ligase-1
MQKTLQLLQDFIIKSNETNSNTDKINVIKEFSQYPEVVKAFEYTYSPFKKYYVTSKNCQTRNELVASKNIYDNIFDLLDSLNNRNITGHSAIQAVNLFVSENSEFAEIVWMILDRNLKTRSTTSMINKVIPGCIPTFEVALADTYNDNTKKKVKWSDRWFVSRKLDGCRCICVMNANGDVNFYSRAGNEFETLGAITAELSRIPQNLVLDGEICMMDENGNEDFQGIMKEIKRKNHTIRRPKFVVFDMLTVGEFGSQTSVRTFSERQKAMNEWFENYAGELDFVAPLEQVKVDTEDEFQEHLATAAAQKWEGLMLRKDATYQGKRSSDIMKVKKFFDDEYVVVDVQMGPNRVIVDGLEVEEMMLRNVVIEHKGCRVAVGSGFNQEQKRQYYKSPGEILGKTITVQYFEESINQDGGFSLRFPVIKHIYENGRTV